MVKVTSALLFLFVSDVAQPRHEYTDRVRQQASDEGHGECIHEHIGTVQIQSLLVVDASKRHMRYDVGLQEDERAFDRDELAVVEAIHLFVFFARVYLVHDQCVAVVTAALCALTLVTHDNARRDTHLRGPVAQDEDVLFHYAQRHLRSIFFS